ncbi:hypothetical protein P0136_09410 [Lentisphaerota bacterium ZTH]|nr:hypothetical protein JYG24_13075 [Lentisphaerota bacterium]WET05581.1 hypothetical protein P0136_09410 [Lentisphaerota bacterium ZTH]
MQKPLIKFLIFMITVAFGLLVSAAEECTVCGKTEEASNCYHLDPSEIPFRKLYFEKIERHLKDSHPQQTNYRIFFNKTYEMYHKPVSQYDLAKHKDDNSCLAYLFQNKIRLQSIPFSIGPTLPFEEIREDLRTASGLEEQELQTATPHATVPICKACLLGNEIYPDGSPEHPLGKKRISTPFNIQLAIIFNKIVNGSDVVFIFHQHDAQNSVLPFLVDYFKVYSQKKAVLGLERFDPEESDFSRPEFSQVKDEIIQKSNEHAFSVISEYALPVYDSGKCDIDDDNDPHTKDVLAFVESRCPHVFCFGLETPISDNRFWESKYFNSPASAYYQEIAQQVFVEVFGNTDYKNEKNNLNKMFIDKFITTFRETELCNGEIAKKIALFFQVINPDRVNRKIPFIIEMGFAHGFYQNDFSEYKLIQSLTKQALIASGYKDIRVTTIMAYPGERLEFFSSNTRFNTRKNPLKDKQIDYAMRFQVPLQYSEHLDVDIN